MCGIAGILSRSNSLDKELIVSMTNAIRHRGPDDEGFLSYNSGNNSVKLHDSRDNFSPVDDCSLLFGHRRLSILDLTKSGHQPFTDSTGRYYIVYNGEIYNYIELREKLISKGYVFKSGTDTEVLLNMYSEYGENCLEELNGMWSFVILDTEKRRLFGARDRFGVKPFYYFYNREYFAFASEIKALLKLPFIPKSINDSAAFDYLTTGRVQDGELTMFDNIFELEPSHSFNFDLNTFEFKKSKYYNLQYQDTWQKFNQQKSEEYIESIRDKMFSAVDLRLRSDVKVGSCLSGGVDSSTIVCVINELLRDHKISQVGDVQKVFTASFPGTSIDETNWAGIVAEAANVEWFKTQPTSSELLNDIEQLVYIQDVPFGSTTIYTQFKVMKLASQNGVKVLLDGQGGDELFTGYTYFLRPLYNEMIRNFDLKSILNEYKNIGNSPIGRKELLVTLSKSFAKLFFPAGIKRMLLKSKDPEIGFINKGLFTKHRNRLEFAKLTEFTKLNDSLHDQFTFSSLRELLKYEDRNSMNFSIEARTPFADDINLIEYVFNIPSSYKIRNGWTKYLLRESMKGIIPDVIRKRTDKLGFATPEYYWLNDIKDELKKYFTPDLNYYFDTDSILKNWDNIFSNLERTGITNFWRFINFAIWKKVYDIK